jgi:nucleoside-diphosphate-sugar epimerase
MRVFITGASGFIGSAVTKELIQHGHEVIGMVRSEEGAEIVRKAGGQVHHGNLKDLGSIKAGAATADGIIHCAFNHDFSKFEENCRDDAKAIEALGEVLEGSQRPLIVTAGVGFSDNGKPRTELDPPNPAIPALPRVSEQIAAAVQAKGVKTMVMRLPQVHDTEKQGLVTFLIEVARQKGVSAYIGEGENRWAAVHISDAAKLYRLVLEKGENGQRYNAVAEEGVPAKAIAEAIASGLKIPVVSKTGTDAQDYFGWMISFATANLIASSTLTQERLGWKFSGVDLLTDLKNMRMLSAPTRS